MKKTIAASELSTIAMTTSNERRIHRVVDGDTVKEWVGIGWIPIRKASKQDRARYPRVVR